MSRDDWFRNEDWSLAIEAAFFAKLARARNKAQYLRIQASLLAQSHPSAALSLLQKYFDLGKHFDLAQAYCDKATAQLSLGDIIGAAASFEAALSHEDTHPHLKTNAYLSLPALIVRERLTQRYEQALEIMEKHRARVTFPVDVFLWNGVLAILLAESGQRDQALQAANAALKAARADHSGFSRHPTIGLVGAKDADLVKRVREIASD